MSFLAWFNSKPFGRNAKRIGVEETSRLSAAYSAAESKCTREYNAVINYAIEKAGMECDTFLRLWREGSFKELRKEFPDFVPAEEPQGSCNAK